MSLTAYKLLRIRKNGTLGPLFINKRQVIAVGEWLDAEDHPTKGFAHRPGWHCAPSPWAPHLGIKERVWCKVLIDDHVDIPRPASQGGRWHLAKRMKVLSVI